MKKIITRTRQYLRGSAICLHPRSCRDFTIIREKYRVQVAATVFPLSQKHGNNTHNKTLITKVQPKPPLHGLSLNKSPIKNYATLFGSDRVVKSNQAKLGSTKPNRKSLGSTAKDPTSGEFPIHLLLHRHVVKRLTVLSFFHSFSKAQSSQNFVVESSAALFES